MMMYYFTYVLGNPKVMSVFGLVSMAGSLAGNILIMPALYRVLRSKGRTAAAGHLFCGISLPSGIRGYPRQSGILGSDVLRGRLYGHVQFRTVQYARRRGGLRRVEGGLRCDGFLSSFTSLALKTGSAIGPALGLYLIQCLPLCAQRGATPRSHHDDEGQYLPDPRDHSSGLRRPDFLPL